MVRIAIVGSRPHKFPNRDAAFNAREAVRQFVFRLAEKDPNTVIVSGGAKGVDTWAVEAAKEAGLATEVFPVSDEEWRRYGKRAGHLRNTRVVMACDALVAFWSGTSTGTSNAIEQAEAAGKKVRQRVFR